ncbi:hypothetical protein D3C86_1369570 [compost metagenome]
MLVGGKLAFVNQEDLVTRHFEQQLVVQTVKFLVCFQDARLDFTQKVARMGVQALLFADDDPPLQFSKTHLVEFIQVIGVNPQKTHTLNQRVALISRFLKDTFVER